MNTTGEIRRANLELLVKQLGTLEAVARAAETTSIYLSQIRNRAVDGKTGRAREMGTAMARRLERAGGRPVGWMDVPHPEVEAAPAQAKLPLHPPAKPPLSPLEEDLLAAFRQLPDEEQEAMAQDAMARAEQIERLVTRALTKRGIPVTGYAADLRVEKAFGRAPAPGDRRRDEVEDTHERRRATDEH